MRSSTGMAVTWKLSIAGLLYMVTVVLGTHFLMFLAPPAMTQMAAGDGMLRLASQFPIGVLVASALAFLVTNIDARPHARWGILVVFLYTVHALTSALEARAFTTMGGTSFLLALQAAPTVLTALAVTRLFAGKTGSTPFLARVRASFRTRSPFSWLWRVIAATIAFPVIYFIMGMVVSPWVGDEYASNPVLHIPPVPVILLTQLLRGALFTAAIIPIVMTWRGTSGRLRIALAWALFVLVGLTGLIAPGPLPAWLRLIHGGEILVDSLVYAAILTRTLRPRDNITNPVSDATLSPR